MASKNREQQLESLRTLLLTIVRGLVENEAAVEYHEAAMEHTWAIEVYVDEKDMGLVLGSNGMHAEAIRKIVNVACKKTDFKCNIDFVSQQRRSSRRAGGVYSAAPRRTTS